MNRLIKLAACAMLMALQATIPADVLHLRQGGQVVGDLVSPTEGTTPNYYLVKTVEGAKLKIAKTQVKRVERKSEAELKYEQYLKKMPDSVEGHWKMSEWCRENRLRRQRAIHLEEIVKRSPDHEEARYGLGYSRIDGDHWVIMDEWMEEQGYVRYGGRWRTRQQAALEEAAQKWEQAQKDWRKDVKMWRGWVDRDRRRGEAIQKFRGIEDPAAVLGLADLLEEETSSVMKKIYVEALGKLNATGARTALVKASIEDPDVSVRSACLRELQKQEFARHAIVPVYIRGLDPKKQPDSIKINRAAEALSWLKDETTVPHLIEALVTEHKSKTGSSGGGSPISASSGSGGLSVGGKKKIIVRHIPNESVRAALRTLTGVDHGFDKEAWQSWYVRDNTPDNIQLRRAE